MAKKKEIWTSTDPNASADDKTMALIREVQRRKDEIARSEKPNWKTNCSFSFVNGKMNDAINLHVETNLSVLIGIVAFLQEKTGWYYSAARELGIEDVAPPFTWNGYSVKDWTEDVKARVGKLQLASKKKKLEELETRLNAIISPDLRAKMELEAIAGALEE